MEDKVTCLYKASGVFVGLAGELTGEVAVETAVAVGAAVGAMAAQANRIIVPADQRIALCNL
jgi:hypothetical protein